VLKALSIRRARVRSLGVRARVLKELMRFGDQLAAVLTAKRTPDYRSANRFLLESFVPDFNARHAVAPSNEETEFSALGPIDLDLLLSVQCQRHVRDDETVVFGSRSFAIPHPTDGSSLAGRPVTIHQVLDGRLAVSVNGCLLAMFTPEGRPLPPLSGRPLPAP
jgi:hypothetical protein